MDSERTEPDPPPAGNTPETGTGRGRAPGSKKTQFRPGAEWRGSRGRPKSSFEASRRLRDAISQLETERGVDIFKAYLFRALKSDRVFVAMMNRLLPLPVEHSVSLADLEEFMGQVTDIIRRHVPDCKVVEAIVDECGRLLACDGDQVQQVNAPQ